MPRNMTKKYYDDWIHRISGTLLGDSAFVIDKRHNARSYRLYFQHTNIDYFNHKIEILGIKGKSSNKITGYGSSAKRFISKALTNTEFPINKFYYTGHNSKCGKRKILNHKLLKKFINLDALALWIADDGSLAYNNKNKLTPLLSLHTQNFNEEQINEIVKFFKQKFGCIPFIYKDKKVKTFGYFLTFNTKDTLFLLNLLRDKHIKGVEYKFYFETKGYLK